MASYTKPEMRERLKNKILNQETAGTESGKWSARKAMLLAKQYKEKGGGYRGQRSEKQKDLKQWAKEND
jgi:hypothetical protein